VGVNLCRHLANLGAEVHAVVRPGGNAWRLPTLATSATAHAVDLGDCTRVRHLVARLEPRFIFHAAAHSSSDHSPALRARSANTLTSLLNVLDAASALGDVKTVLLGSSLAYGPGEDAHREENSLRPRSLRGAFKAASSLIAFAYARERNLRLTELRLFSVYGPWEPLSRLVPRAIAAAIDGEALPLTGPGARRDFVYVEDVARACALAAMREEADGCVINIGSGHELANEELVAAVSRVLDRSVRTKPGAYPLQRTDTSHWRADPSRARSLLGWVPEHSLDQGLAITAAWFREASRRGGESWLRSGLEIGMKTSQG